MESVIVLFFQNIFPCRKSIAKKCVLYQSIWGKIVEYALDELSKLGFHLLIEGTLRTTEVSPKNGAMIDN